MTKLPLFGAALWMLCACSPAEMADKVGRRAAETVVLPVVARSLPGPQSGIMTRCIVENASAADIQTLARDVGVEAGSATIAKVMALARNPATRACLATAGLDPSGVM
jgi:hypothetical protein